MILILGLAGFPQIGRLATPEKANNWCLVVPHGDETDALDAAQDFVRAHGGTVFRFVSTTRNVTWKAGEHGFTVDPNRIFTATGRTDTLRKLNKVVPDGAEAETARIADGLTAAVSQCLERSPHKLVLAVHNNDDGGYGIGSYDGATVHPEQDPDDFFYVTRAEDRDRLSAYNIYLQSDDIEDDGSMSVAWKDWRYINVEVQHGRKDAHLERIEVAAGLR